MGSKSKHLQAHEALTAMIARYADEALANWRTGGKDDKLREELELQKKRLVLASQVVALFLDRIADEFNIAKEDQEHVGGALANIVGAGFNLGAYLGEMPSTKRWAEIKRAHALRDKKAAKGRPQRDALLDAVVAVRGNDVSLRPDQEARQISRDVAKRLPGVTDSRIKRTLQKLPSDRHS
jgi:hypothetical protein